ncbi:MAG: hypothetical protein RMJ17_03070 [Candidatus Aenigmarchaeota archaeon]|nr:hypothetical protein [Candidatus Aenigmarchaeota archaeon]MDW8149548.1 hypothetical protein [Candidatus Aenigmarchaeota archaeon]
MVKRKTEIGICDECKVRENDSSKKELFRCKYCGRFFCKKHLPPRLAVLRSSIEEIKDPILKDRIYEEWRKSNGHPDWVWSRKHLEELKIKEEEDREKFLKFLDELKGIKIKEPITTSSKINKTRDFIKEFFWKIGVNPYDFIKHILIVLTILVIIHFFMLGKFGLLFLVLRAIGLVLFGYFLSLIYRKTKHFIPYK